MRMSPKNAPKGYWIAYQELKKHNGLSQGQGMVSHLGCNSNTNMSLLRVYLLILSVHWSTVSRYVLLTVLERDRKNILPARRK
jgi:hypothetical protein